MSTVSAAERIALKGGEDMRGARGEAVISDAGAGSKEVVITASGLKPSEVYTVWLVNMKPKMDMAGLGTGDTRSPAMPTVRAATRPLFLEERSTSKNRPQSRPQPPGT